MAGCLPCEQAAQSCATKIPTSAVTAACTIGTVPFPAEIHARACLPGDPGLSSLEIARRARAESLWTRSLLVVVTTAGAFTDLVVILPAFAASGRVCAKSVTMLQNAAVVAVDAIGITGVWDMVDSPGAPQWQARVGEACMHETLGVQTTTGRCPCDAACEDCIYPAAVGGLFVAHLRFASRVFAVGDVISVTLTGTFKSTAPCCSIPLSVGEPVVVAGPYPALQSLS